MVDRIKGFSKIYENTNDIVLFIQSRWKVSENSISASVVEYNCLKPNW